MIDLELCKKFWHRIYHIQRRNTYSFYEIEKLVKDIDKIKDECPNQERLLVVIDECYRDMDSPELERRIVLIDHLRSIFHKPLKEEKENPLNTKRRNKLMKRALERISL